MVTNNTSGLTNYRADAIGCHVSYQADSFHGFTFSAGMLFSYRHCLRCAEMELYLRWLAKYEQQSHELSPIGLILCTDKNDELIELLELDSAGIHVAQYLLEFPSKELLKQKLHLAIQLAQQRIKK